jgi:hypothetical protein
MSAKYSKLYTVAEITALLRVRVDGAAVYGGAMRGIHVDLADGLTNADGSDKPSYLKLVAPTHRILQVRVRDNRNPRVRRKRRARSKCKMENDASEDGS